MSDIYRLSHVFEGNISFLLQPDAVFICGAQYFLLYFTDYEMSTDLTFTIYWAIFTKKTHITYKFQLEVK